MESETRHEDTDIEETDIISCFRFNHKVSERQKCINENQDYSLIKNLSHENLFRLKDVIWENERQQADRDKDL